MDCSFCRPHRQRRKTLRFADLERYLPTGSTFRGAANEARSLMTLVGRTLAMASNSRTNYYAAAAGRALAAARGLRAQLRPDTPRDRSSIAATRFRNNDLQRWLGLMVEQRKSAHGAKSAVQQHLVEEGEAGQRLDKLLGQLLPAVPRTHIFRLIRKGEVRVDGKRASPERRVAAGERVRVPPVRERSETAQLVASGGAARVPPALIARVSAAIVHEDERLLGLHNPPGLAVHGGSRLSYAGIETLPPPPPPGTLAPRARPGRDTRGAF